MLLKNFRHSLTGMSTISLMDFPPTFTYEALNDKGKPQKGVIEANTSEEAIGRIKSQGFFPTAVREQKVKKSAVAGEAAAKPKKKPGGGISIGHLRKRLLTPGAAPFRSRDCS